ncbi:MAG: hypothetical protein OCD76_08070 [Reichenbachiella sp.]
MIQRLFTTFCLFTFVSIHTVSGQCPSDQTNLEAGGTFSGDCIIDVDGNAFFNNSIIWTSGSLTINDNGSGDGDVTITANVIFQSNTSFILDDGDLNINNLGILTMLSNTSLDIIGLGKDIIINDGNLSSIGNITVSDDIFVSNGGILELNGGITDVNSDIFVDDIGSEFNIDGDAIIDDCNDITLSNNSSGTIGANAVVKMMDNLTLDGATFNISGELQNVDPGTGANDIILNGAAQLTTSDNASVTDFRNIIFGADDGAATLTIDGGSIAITNDVLFNNSLDNENIIINSGDLIVEGNIDIGTTSGSIVLNPEGTLDSNTIDDGQPESLEDLPDQITQNGGTIIINNISLPVDLLSFEAYHNTELNQNVISWKTSSETNNTGFYVEKSFDNLNFESIGFIEGHGNSNWLQHYEFYDHSLSHLCYYRLKQVDYDGLNNFSEVISLSLIEETIFDIEVFPNPIVSHINFSGDENILLQFSLLNKKGQLLYNRSTNLENAKSDLNDILNRSSQDMFYLKIAHGQYQNTIKLITTK